MNMISFRFWVHFLLDFVNSILFATLLNQMSYNRRKTDGKTQKSKRKCFFQQKCFWYEPKIICKFFRRFVCWKPRRKQVAIHKKSNYILQVFVLLFSFRPSFRKIRLISKFMTSNSGKQITAIHIIAQYLNKETQSDNEIRSVNRI